MLYKGKQWSWTVWTDREIPVYISATSHHKCKSLAQQVVLWHTSKKQKYGDWADWCCTVRPLLTRHRSGPPFQSDSQVNRLSYIWVQVNTSLHSGGSVGANTIGWWPCEPKNNPSGVKAAIIQLLLLGLHRLALLLMNSIKATSLQRRCKEVAAETVMKFRTN